MKNVLLVAVVLAASCLLWKCGGKGKREKAAEDKQVTVEKTRGIDNEFLATMKTISVYDPALEEAVRTILDDFDKRYTSGDAKTVLKTARRIWFPDNKSGVVVRSGGFTRAGGHTFTWTRGKATEADREFFDAYAGYLAAPPGDRKKIRESLPTEGVSEHLRSMLRDDERTVGNKGNRTP